MPWIKPSKLPSANSPTNRSSRNGLGRRWQITSAPSGQASSFCRRCLFAIGFLSATRPVEEDGRRFNEAFIWSGDDGYRPIRRKWYLPEAPTAQETLWFNQGDCDFAPVRADAVCVGFQLCSEMMFTQHARDMGFDGAHLIVQPRASGHAVRWRIASEMSAIASGGYVASSNRRSFSRNLFAGGSWVLSPDAHALCETTEERPFATAEIDLAAAERAKLQYPRDLYRRYRA